MSRLGQPNQARDHSGGIADRFSKKVRIESFVFGMRFEEMTSITKRILRRLQRTVEVRDFDRLWVNYFQVRHHIGAHIPLEFFTNRGLSIDRAVANMVWRFCWGS
jgi:hypothetical protein